MHSIWSESQQTALQVLIKECLEHVDRVKGFLKVRKTIPVEFEAKIRSHFSADVPSLLRPSIGLFKVKNVGTDSQI